jgi:hypothetical protein
VDAWRGRRRISHGGADAGFRTFVAFFPELDAGVIVLSNLGSFDPSGVASRVAEAYFGDALAPASAPPPPPVATVASVTIDPARLDALTGDFASPTFSFTATRERDQLFVQAPGQPRFQLRPTSDSTFAIPEVSATLTFARRAGGRADTVRLVQGGAPMVLVRRAPYAPTAADLAALAGRYYSPELDVAYDLALDGAALVLRRRHNADMPLTVGGRDTFGGSWPVQTLRLERDAAGRATGFRVTSGRVRDVRFARQDSTTSTATTPNGTPR